jgi:hypothetical protein
VSQQITRARLFALAGLAFLLSAVSFGFNFLNFSGAEQAISTCTASPVSNACLTKIQSGSFTPTIAGGAISTTGSVTFSPAYTSSPVVSMHILFDPLVGTSNIVSQTVTLVDPANSLFVISDDETQTSVASIPNADTNQKTFSLSTNGYTSISVESEGYVSCGTLSTNQAVNIKIKVGATQKGQTMIVDCALSATAIIPFSIKAVFAQTASGTIAVTVGAAAADANTSMKINSLRVYGIGPIQTWSAMPAATTEIFGSTKNRASLSNTGPQGGSAVQLTLSVNVVLAGVAGSKLELQTSGDLSTWTDPCSPAGSGDVSISSTGVNAVTCTFPVGTVSSAAYIRLVGLSGNGVISPEFGLVTATFDQSVSTASEISFSSPFVTSIGFTWLLSVSFPPSNSAMYTVTWFAGIPA